MTTEPSLASDFAAPLDPLDFHVESFLKQLRASGYASRTLRRKRWIATIFVRWTRRKQLAIRDLNEANIAAFLKRSPRRRKARAAFELSVLRPFLAHLRMEGCVRSSTACMQPSAVEDVLLRYLEYLRNERGLAQNSLNVYSAFVHDFLRAQTALESAGFARLDARVIQDFLLDRTRDRSSEYCRLLAISLRSFLRFLFLHGETAIDLSLCVPSVRKWRQAAVPPFLSAEEVERLLSATDRTTPGGRRDYAILLLLARLGLRAGEVVRLNLEDIRWRTAEIIVPGKGPVSDRLPLLSDIGEALTVYLRKDRGQSPSRRVFLRMIAPRVGLTGPAAIGGVVRQAFARAGINRTGRGAAHLFRHSLATRMIRQGASIGEIAEILRHRSQSTTQIYAKVDFETLREVARPWPGTGGTR